MRDTHVLAGLVKKRAEIAGEILGAKQFIAAAVQQLAIVDQALTLFGYDDPTAIEPIIKRPACLFAHSELKRLIIDIQRDRPDLTRHKEIAQEIIRRKEWDADGALLASIITRVKKAKKWIRRGDKAGGLGKMLQTP